MSVKLFVTGPQRSGTTFVSNCLARSFSAQMIDETEFDVYFYGRFKMLASRHDSWVVHAPALFHKIFDVVEDFPDSTIVIVKRNINEIIKSQERIAWSDVHERTSLRVLPGDNRPISEIKYEVWEKWKKDIPSWVEYQYSDFECHPLWVNESERCDFHSKQWQKI